MTIRNALSTDAMAIKNLLAQLGYPDLTEQDAINNIKRHSSEGYRLLVAEEDKTILGFIALHWFDLLHWKEKIGRISAFCVDESARSKGVGKKLLKATEDLFAAQGCAKLEVTSNARRTRAHQFYLNLGYEEDSRRFVKYLQQGH